MSEQSIRWRRAVPVAALALITAAGLASAAGASADPLGASGAGKGSPAAPPTATADDGCTLSPSLTSKPERTSCIGVGATLSSLPAVGQTATLTVTVKTGRAEKATRVTVDLPATLAFADGTAAVAAVTGAGKSSQATLATLDLAKGATRTWTRTVKAVAPGAGEIQAAARSVVGPGRIDSGADFVRLTVGAAGTASTSGNASSGISHAVARTTAAAPPVVSRPEVKLPAIANTPASKPGKAPGTSCMTGSWNFLDAGGISRGVGKVLVQVYLNGGGILASGFADGVGNYNVCFATGGVTKSVFVRFILTNSVYRIVSNSGSDFYWSTGAVSVADNTTYNFGYLRPADSLGYRPNHAYLDASTMYDWIYQNSPGRNPAVGCWSPYASSCLPLVVHWDNANPAPSFFDSGTQQVTLAGDAPDSEDRPVHEYGHALMFGLYGNTFPATTNCSSHSLFVASSTTCGWTEGWGDWVDTSVWNNTLYTFAGGGTANFNTTWGDGQDTGDQVEGRVVQALDSINDGVKYPFDNIAGAGYNYAANYFTVLRTYKPTTFAAFWSGRASAGQDVSQASLSALYQGTIDYGFRNPLGDYVGKSMPQAVPPHNYSYATNTGYWSAVGVLPSAGSDVDLTLFNDYAQTSSLGSSSYGGTTADFVAVNSNSGVRPLQAYYPRVTQFAGTGSYAISLAQGSRVLTTGVASTTTVANQPVQIWDSSQATGVPVYYRAVPAAGQSLALSFLQPGQTIVGRTSAVNSGAAAGGSPVSLVATPTASGYGGLVLVNQGLTSGGVTVYADTTAPAATISIAGGAASTTTATDTVTLGATDTQTGVVSMQLSVDGTFDTEPVVAYSTSASVQLVGPNGTKTVYARFLNNAGMWSAAVSDTINLAVPPKVRTLSPASGPAAGGTKVTVKGTRFTGATAVVFGTRAATSFTVVNDTTIRAVAPSGTGAVTIRVTVPAGTATSTATFAYIPAPVITSITPQSGTAGTVVTVNGANFTGATQVQFGLALGTNVVVVSSTRIQVTAPAGSGRVNVKVTTPGGSSPVVPADRFTYTG